MSKLKINDLPPEMLTKVLLFLDVVNLKNASLTCKLWKNLIESACRWSLELPYDDYGELSLETQESEEKMNFVLTTNRKFDTITIREGRISKNNQILKIFQRHGCNVIKLILCDCRIDNLIVFAELLNLTTNLNNVDIESKFLCDLDDEALDQVLPELNKLRILEIGLYDERIIKCFIKAKLTSIKVWEYGQPEHCGPLTDFIVTQEMLTSLTVDNKCSSRSVLFEMGKLTVSVPFRLTRLAITDSYGEKLSHDHDNLLRFIKSQAKNLEELELGWNVPNSVHECVFASMPKLNSLSVITGEIPRDIDFYNRLKENRSVQTIILLINRKDDDQFFRNFLDKFPNIRCLILPYTGIVDRNTLVAVAQNLEKLESLSIKSIDECSVDCVKFSNLKTLHIQDLRVKINWNEFTKIHSQLTELIVEEMGDESFLTCDDIDHITTNVDLQHIRLGAGFVADDRFFEIIRTKCTNLKLLDLHKSCVSHGLNCNVGINVLRVCDAIKYSKYAQMLC